MIKLIERAASRDISIIFSDGFWPGQIAIRLSKGDYNYEEIVGPGILQDDKTLISHLDFILTRFIKDLDNQQREPVL